jgi:hypothetical protein
MIHRMGRHVLVAILGAVLAIAALLVLVLTVEAPSSPGRLLPSNFIPNLFGLPAATAPAAPAPSDVVPIGSDSRNRQPGSSAYRLGIREVTASSPSRTRGAQSAQNRADRQLGAECALDHGSCRIRWVAGIQWRQLKPAVS